MNTDLNIRLNVIAGQAQAEFSKIHAGLNRIGDAFKKTGHYGAIAFALPYLSNAIGGVRNAASQVVRLADAMAKLDARIRAIADTDAAFVESKRRVREIALQTGESLETTAQSYIRLATAVKAAGGNQQQALAITSALADALDVNDASAEASTTTFTLLSKAITQGVIGTRELNTLTKQSPRALQALADGLHVPVERLWDMAKAGQLTADVFGRSLISQMGRLRAESAAMPPVIGEAVENLRTQWAALVDDMNTTLGATQGLAAGIQLVGENIRGIAVGAVSLISAGLGVLAARMVQAAATAFALRSALAATAAQSRVLVAGFSATGVAASATALQVGVLSRTLAVLGGWPGLIAAALAAAIPAWALWASAGKRAADEVGDALSRAQQRAARSGRTDIEELGREQLRLQAAIVAAERSKAAADAQKPEVGAFFGDGTAGAVARRRAEAKARLDGLRAQLAGNLTAQRNASERDARLSGGAGGSGDALAAATSAADRAADADVARLKTTLAEKQALYDQAKLGELQFLDIKRQLAQQEIGIEEAKQHALLQAAVTYGNADKAADARSKLAVLTEQRKQIDVQAAADRAQIERDSQARITAIEVEGLRARGDLVQAFARDFFAQHQQEIQRLLAAGQAGAAELAALMQQYEAGIAKTQQDQMAGVLERATQQLDALRQRLDAEVAIHIKSETEAQRELRAESARLASDLDTTLVPSLERLIATAPEGPDREKWRAMRAEIEAMRDRGQESGWAAGITAGLRGFADEAGTVFQGVQESVKGAFSGMTDAITEFVMTGKASFSDLANSIIRDMIRIMVQQSITGPLAQMAGNLIGSFFGPAPGSSSGPLMASAKGNVFSSAGLHAHVNTILSRPTIFPFARGGAFGLAGEAGPEAIMPLSRDSSGRLGVHASGGGGNVSVVVHNNSGQPAQTRESTDNRGGRRVEVIIGDMMASEVRRPGSMLHSSMRAGFGVQPSLIGRG